MMILHAYRIVRGHASLLPTETQNHLLFNSYLKYFLLHTNIFSALNGFCMLIFPGAVKQDCFLCGILFWSSKDLQWEMLGEELAFPRFFSSKQEAGEGVHGVDLGFFCSFPHFSPFQNCASWFTFTIIFFSY